MAINVYCGVMGSGKSYEVVQGPLLDAIACGRRVVTNVDGIDEEAIHEYLRKRKGAGDVQFGSVVHVRTEQMCEPKFFPVELEGRRGVSAQVVSGFVEPGDLLVVDEAWKLWASDKPISDEHMSFFRMHRHFTHPQSGVSCDIVLMIQGIADLHRKLKEVVELSFRMHKLKSLGLASRYRVEQYEGWKQNGKTRIATYVRKYKKDVFPLYKSYASTSAAGQEAVVDNRQNVLTNKTLWIVAIFLIVMSALSGRFLWTFFHQRSPAAGRSAPSSTKEGELGSVEPSHSQTQPQFSEKWRIAGGYSGQSTAWIVVVDGDGRLRVESPSMFENSGVSRIGAIDGQRVTTFSGAKPAGPSDLLGQGKAVGGIR